MREKTIVQIALVTLILGLSFLLLYAGDVSLPKATSLDGLPPQEEVAISGVVENLNRKGNTLFFQVNGQRLETLDIIAFPEEELYLKEGDVVEIQGLVEEYNGQKEVIADTIRKR